MTPTLDGADINRMHDIEGMRVMQHHFLCLGVLALCYQHVPEHLQAVIMDGLNAAQQMGAGIEPNNVRRGLPLRMFQ